MRTPQRARSTSIGINMTPMIDVVFQLIIFFLVASHLVKQEAQMPLPLPIADSALPAEVEPTRPQLVVNVLSDGQLLLAGRSLDLPQFRQRLQEAHDAQPEVEVKIRADRRVEYRHVEPIMMTCYRAGLRNVTYSVYRSRDVR